MAHGSHGTADHGSGNGQDDAGTRRDFLTLFAVSLGAFGTAAVVWPLIHQMNPSKDTLALSTTEVDLSGIEVGQSITVMWRGNPVFVRHRSPEEIKAAQDVAPADLEAFKDPQTDAERVQAGREQWLILVGVCTHLGCIPQGQRATENRGPFGGWLCSCHGSQYDTSGRIRLGPAPKNLEVPTYSFKSDTVVVIG